MKAQLLVKEMLLMSQTSKKWTGHHKHYIISCMTQWITVHMSPWLNSANVAEFSMAMMALFNN